MEHTLAPGVPHVIPTKLDPAGSNFSLWRYRMEILFQSCDLWRLVDGTDIRGSAPYNTATWDIRDASARLQIVHNLPDSVLWIVQQHDSAAAQWVALHEHFLPRSSYKGLYALKYFLGTRLAEGSDVVEHVNYMGTLWREVIALGAYKEQMDPDAYFSITLLNSLPPSWEDFVKLWIPEVTTNRLPSSAIIGRLLDMNFIRQARKVRPVRETHNEQLPCA